MLLNVGNAGAANYAIAGDLTNAGTNWNLGNSGVTTINSGGTLNESLGVSNAGGSLTINSGGSLEADSFTQSAGTTDVYGSLAIGSLADPGDILVTGGVFNYSGAANILGNILVSGTGVAALSGDSSIFGDVTLDFGSSLTGDHTISGDYNGDATAVVVNSGVVTPGDAPGTDTINGSFSQTSTGELDIELGGTGAGQFGQLVVNGTATLGGTLDVTLYDGFTPVAGDTFQIVTDVGNERCLWADSAAESRSLPIPDSFAGCQRLRTHRGFRGAPEPGTALLLSNCCWRVCRPPTQGTSAKRVQRIGGQA